MDNTVFALLSALIFPAAILAFYGAQSLIEWEHRRQDERRLSTAARPNPRK